MKFPEIRPWQVAVVLLLFIGLIVLSLSGYMGEVLGSATNPLVSLQSWLSTHYVALYEFFTAPRDVMSLRQENAELTNAVAELQKQVIELEEQLREADVYYALLDFARSNPENQYIASSVIGRDPSPFMGYIILNHGTNNGVRRDMPVVTEQGLVGRVDAVTANACRVQLISDPGFNVNVHTQETRAEGLIVGSITGDLEMQMVTQDRQLTPDDLVLTSGLGGKFPSNVLVGKIETVIKRENALFQRASVQSAVDFRSLRVVLLIRNFEPVEIEPLIPEEETE